jgi:hypothetical protein
VEQCQSAVCSPQQFDVFAQFFTTSQGNMGCTTVTNAGSCAYYSGCPNTTQNGVSAGTLTVTGPWLVPPVTITPMSGTNAYQYFSSTPGFTAGQTLTVSGSGATVPAFGPVSVVAPQLTQLVQPPVTTDGGTTIIPTSADLPVQWTGAQPGATMILEAVSNSGTNYTVCTWNASDGKDIVPVTVLYPLSGQSGYFFYGQYNETFVSAGPFPVTLDALPYTGSAVSFQ